MRITRILLVLAFLAVAAVFTVQDMAGRFSTADEPPVLSCGSELLQVSVADGDDVLLTGLTAEDPQDGDITHRILVTGVSQLMEGNVATVSYAVFDSDHNMATLSRRIHYTDYRLPRFALDAPLVYTVDSDIRLLDRLRAVDVVDGNITNNIRVTYTDAVIEEGIRSVGVQVTNTMGDTAWLTLPVVFVDSLEDRVEVELDTYLLYLNRGDNFDARRFLERAAWKGAPVSLENVTIRNDVDTAVPGTYYVEYTCVYGSHSGTVVLTVVVE